MRLFLLLLLVALAVGAYQKAGQNGRHDQDILDLTAEDTALDRREREVKSDKQNTAKEQTNKADNKAKLSAMVTKYTKDGNGDNKSERREEQRTPKQVEKISNIKKERKESEPKEERKWTQSPNSRAEKPRQQRRFKRQGGRQKDGKEDKKSKEDRKPSKKRGTKEDKRENKDKGEKEEGNKNANGRGTKKQSKKYNRGDKKRGQNRDKDRSREEENRDKDMSRKEEKRDRDRSRKGENQDQHKGRKRQNQDKFNAKRTKQQKEVSEGRQGKATEEEKEVKPSSRSETNIIKGRNLHNGKDKNSEKINRPQSASKNIARNTGNIGIQEICEGGIVLGYGESVVIYTDNDRQKKKCKNKIKTPKGTEIGFFCPFFNLNSKGCKRELLKFRGKVNGKKQIEEYCEQDAPDGVIISTNKLTMAFSRKQFKSNEFSGGLLCEIYTVGVTPTTTFTSPSPSTAPPSPGTTPCSITREYCNGCGVAPISVGSTKIVNGTAASVGEYPYQVAVLSTIAGRQYQCGGSIIKERWILTAAHCFYDNSNNKATSVDIIYGTININDIGGTRVTASRFIDHPGYDSSTYANDIALVELPQSLNYATDAKIQPICLGLEEDIPFGGKAVASGWGALSFEGSSPDVLQEVELDIITINECQQKESLPPDTNSVVCALTLYKDTCQGDSGGPLVAKLCDGTWAQIGIVSYGFQCAVPGKPGVYTRVSAFASWISNNTGGSSCSSTLTLSAELDNRAKEREAVNEAKNEVVRIGQGLDGLETTLNATRGRRRRRRNLTLLQELTTALNKSADVLLSRNVQRINSLSSELAALRGRLVVFTAQVAAGASGLDVPALLAGVGSAKQTAQNATKVARQELAEIEVEIQIIVAKFENSGSTVPPLPSLEPEPTVKPVTPTTSPTTPPPTTPNVPTTIAPSTTASPPTPTTAPPSPGTSTCSITREYCNGCGVAPISVGSTKIVNGTVASVGEYPYQVGVLPTIAGLEYRCGGSIIKERWILTAAHCFYDKSSNKATSVDIIYGTIFINGIGGTRVTASRFIDHPGYNSSTKANDIALVELPQPLNYTIDAKIQPICLGLQEDIPFGGKAVASGWGDLSFDGLSPNVLQEVELDIITIDECQQKESLPPDTNSVVCALTLYKDTCQGDSGGPLVAKLCDGTWAQIGIVSYGFQCAVPDNPGVYTRVSTFASWISDNTGGSSCSSTLTLSAELDNRAKEKEAVNEAKNEVVRIEQDLDGLETTLNAASGRRRRRRNLTLLQELATALINLAPVLLSRNVQRIISLSSELAALRGRLVVFNAEVAAGASGLDVAALLAGVGSAKQTAQNATKVARQELADIEVEIQVIVVEFENSGSTVPPLPSLEPEPTVKPVTPTASPTTPPPTTPPPTTPPPTTPPPTTPPPTTPPPTTPPATTPPPTTPPPTTPPPTTPPPTTPPPTTLPPTTLPPTTSTAATTEITSSTCSVTRKYYEDCGVATVSVADSRIVGGADASAGEFPWQVGLATEFPSGGGLCGGSLIKSNWVLTAAHCFFDDNGNAATSVVVQYGSINLATATEVTALRYITHEDYNSTSLLHDIALIELPQALAYANDPNVQPICLGEEEDYNFGGKVVATGWGDLSYDTKESPDTLQEVMLDLITTEECKTTEDLPSDTSVICALTPNKDTCSGDSGGPLFTQLCDGRWAQLGIVSYGFECARPSRPGVYTKVSAYFDWIETNSGVADVEGGFAEFSGEGSADVAQESAPIFCAAVLCVVPEEVDQCTEVPGACCSQWICGDGPRECVLETGEVYQIGDTWDNACEICYCQYTSDGAEASCYKRQCIPAPHRDCEEVERDGECCPDYRCGSTTCQVDGRYYGVGESWQTKDFCQTCRCTEGDPVPVIECEEPEVCRSPPSPACRPIASARECCPVGWDCSDSYLITVPKVFVRGGQSTVCVFLEDDPPISVNLTLTMMVEKDEVHVTVVETVSTNRVCVDFPVPDGGDTSAALLIEGSIGEVLVSKELRISLVSVGRTFVQTDKYLYEEGQSVKFRVLSVEGERAAISYEDLDEVWVTSPTETRLVQWLNVSNSRGLVQLEFPLAEHVQEGAYTIHVRTGGRVTAQDFKVEPYVLPRFEVTLNLPPYTLVSQTLITVEVCADYTYGQPVTGSGSLFVKKNRYYYFEDTKDDVLTIPIPTFTGCTDVEVDTGLIDTVGYGFIGVLALTADITEEGTGHMASGAATLELASERLSFVWISRGKDAKPGLPLEMQIQARFPDQSGAPDVEVTACVETACKDFVTDEHGVFSVVVPPHLVKPYGNLKVTLANEDKQEGNLGNLYPSEDYFYFDVYYSESNSSLSLVIPTDAVDCTPGGDISLSLPVLFVANNINQALMRLQVISRSQVILVDSFVQDLVASDLALDEDALLEPVKDLDEGFVRGSFSVQLELPYYASPSVNVLVWYSTAAGEVIAGSGTVEVGACLPTVASLAWAPAGPAAPKDNVQITITASPNSICSLGVVDRSVEILSRGKTGSLSTAAVFQLLTATEPYKWLGSQIDNYGYCSGDTSPPFNEDVVEIGEIAKRSYYWMPYTTSYIDALSAFNDATLLVVSDLTIETRPCEVPDFGGFDMYGGGAVYAAGPLPGGIPDADGAIEEDDSGAGDEIKEAEEQQEPRAYFPETWLWDIYEIGDAGSTSFSARVPDTVTEWVGEAVCVNPELGLGLSPPTTLTVFTPFFLDLTTPPSVRRQERVPLRVSVFNYLDQTLPVSVSLSPNATFTAEEYAHSVCVPAHSMRVAEFVVVPQEAGDVGLTFSASVTRADEGCDAGDDLPTKSDVMIKPLKVVFEGVQREIVHGVFLCGDGENETWSLATPSGIVEGSERVFVSASADLLGPSIENLGNLVRMPYGCGEQNMINFVPNIYVVKYLDSIGQGDSDIVDQATSFMITGYQRELTYRRSDGSYSAFGDSDSEGSTWLTAFVLRSFAEASQYITIDENDLQVTADWLLSLQMDDGCFQSVGHVHHQAMKGGLGSASASAVPLSAYVAIALSEAGHFGAGALPAAVSCIASDTAATDVYSESLKAYALALASSADAPAHIAAAYDLLTAGDDEGESIWVESAAYTVLAMLKVDHEDYVSQAVDLIRRMSSHRNSLGGFHSTQDTVLALEAFAEYSILFPPSDTNLELAVTAITSFNILIEAVNQLVVQTRDIEDPLPYDVTVTPSGTGCAVFMVVHQFHMPEIAASATFSMTVTSTSGSCTAANVTICAFYLLENEESNMVIVELDLESGYVAEEASLQRLVDGKVAKKYEQDEPGVVELYLDSLTSAEVCLTVAVSREILVEDVKPGTVSIYDYYQNSEDKLVKPLVIDRTGCAVAEGIA